MREKIKDDQHYLITTEDLLQWEIEFNRNLEPLIILWTGWAERWPDKEKYLGTSSNDIKLLRFPGMSSFIQIEVLKRNVKVCYLHSILVYFLKLILKSTSKNYFLV